MGYQRVILIGQARADAQCKKAPEGSYCISFELAVTDDQDRPTYFPVRFFGVKGAMLCQDITQGSRVLVEGHLKVTEHGRFYVEASDLYFSSVSHQACEGSELDEE
ncbi:MAG: single-stranded DNA-binding protein [Chloroflexota bacterium]|nr:single-stranded DNA-binding protein [Chloroflexota bacterium]